MSSTVRNLTTEHRRNNRDPTIVREIGDALLPNLEADSSRHREVREFLLIGIAVVTR